MPIIGKEYDQMTKEASPPSRTALNAFKAFLIGGLVCMIGEAFYQLYLYAGLDDKQARAGETVTLIAITAILTALGVFDKIARHAGAGTIVPITGFANSVVSPALEFQSEGRIMGTGVQMFTIAGPVIVYGTGAAVLYGLIIYLFQLY